MLLTAKRLRMAREWKKLTQIHVKALTNINNKTLSGYEHNVSEPDLQTLNDLSNLYEVSIDWLTGLTDDPTPSKPLSPERLRAYNRKLEKIRRARGESNRSEEEPTEIERELYENIHLDDETLFEHFKFFVDERPATKEEIQEVIDYVRAKRIMNDQKAKKNI